MSEPVNYVGWYRPPRGRTWRRVAEGPDHEICWHRLRDVMAGGNLSGDSCVLHAGRNPNNETRGR